MSDLLTEHFNLARIEQPNLSKRAFAKVIGISHGALIEIMAGKRAVSHRVATRISESLGLSKIEYQRLLISLAEPRKKKTNRILHGEHYEVLTQWQHFAILNLIQLPDVQLNSKQIAARLGLSLTETERSLNRLEKLKLVSEEDTFWQRTCENLTSTDEIKSAAVSQWHLNYLDLAATKMTEVSHDKRDYTTMTMGINPKKIKEFKIMIREFQDRVSEVMEDEDASEVYIFGSQLVPLTLTKEIQ